MALRAGDTLLNGKYVVSSQLGRGGYGFVYQAQDTLLGEDVAIKELIPALVDGRDTLRRFLAEARATVRVSHPHIVRTFDVFREGDNYHIVMECMDGGSLETRLRKEGPLSVDEALRIALDVCRGLAHAHSLGIVHCDLKPANILFDADGSAKVADFGIAHLPEQVLTRTWNTPQGFVAGTLPYMSPEQADGVRDDPRVDVYALGAALYRMLTGRTYLDFDQRETPGATADNVNRIRHQQPIPPSTQNPHVPGWLDTLVLKALAKQPHARYKGAGELRTELLRRKAPQEGIAAPSAETRPSSPQLEPPPSAALIEARPIRRTLLPAWFWAVAGAAIVLLVVLVSALGVLVAGGDGNTVAVVGVTAEAIATVRATATRSPEPTPMPMATSTMLPADVPKPTATFTHTPIPPTHTPKPKAPTSGATQTRTKDGMVMVYVPAGEFAMGSDDGDDDEQPVHTVYLDAYWIDRTEVTNAQFGNCVAADACRAPTACGGYEAWSPFEAGLDLPVVCVDLNDAETYCEWAGARLPTEAEWEKAGRGSDGRVYPWGNGEPTCDKANSYDDNKREHCVGNTTKVGSHPSGASPYGALDMAGNVWEWVADWYDANYYANSPVNNPKAPNSGDYRVLRGGSWSNDWYSVRAANRYVYYPDDTNFNFGFRCAGSAGE